MESAKATMLNLKKKSINVFNEQALRPRGAMLNP